MGVWTSDELHFPVLVSAAPADDRTWVLKHGETFAVFDHTGDIRPSGLGEQGLYHTGTRFLSRLTIRLDGQRLLLLGANVAEDNAVLTVHCTNPDFVSEPQPAGADSIDLPYGTIHLVRSTFLTDGVCFTRLSLRNYGLSAVTVTCVVDYHADFVDIFEVRGTKRAQRGQLLEPVFGASEVVLGYQGLDSIIRRTRLVATPAPAAASATTMRFEVALEPKGEAAVTLMVVCELGQSHAHPLDYTHALEQTVRSIRWLADTGAAIVTSNAAFNTWSQRSLADLQLLTTKTHYGPFPYAGIPWYSTAFGRDGIITALEYLWVNPNLARGVVAFLAATQARVTDLERAAEPGKIMHETRRGEMAALNEIPFGRYYGSIDATPLFIVLAGAYYRRTGDRSFIAAIWPAITGALHWLDTSGDLDGDGFVEYVGSPTGLLHQGWKDSSDPIVHADGRAAEGPVALCEVQAYVYAARLQAATIADVLGEDERATGLRQQAAALRSAFNQVFWCEELSSYALALDGAKRPCQVLSSNAGHTLFGGIAEPALAERLVATLFSERSFSGWGIRTLAAGERRYNPMSYHNGSVWPHDNAIIAVGLAQYGFQEAALKLLGAAFDASRMVNLHRLPELFCGFDRQPGYGPTLYPVACAPQAWSAGAVFWLLQACLGLDIDGPTARLCFTTPRLPEWLRTVQVMELRVGQAVVDLALHHHASGVNVQIMRREGRLEVITTA